MNLFRFAWLTGMLAVVLCGLASPAAARDYPLEDVLCIGGASSAGEALALPIETLDCGPLRFDNGGPFIRTHAWVEDAAQLHGQDLVWLTDPTSFDSMLVLFRFDNGELRMVDVDPQMAARNWFAGARFSIPVPQVGADLIAVDTVVERPRTNAVAKNAWLMDRSAAQAQHYSRSLFFSLICGLLLAPFVLDFIFVRMLRVRFVVWHAGMTLGFLAFVYFSSGLVFLAFPNLALEARFQTNTLSLAIAVACAVMFVLAILEKGLVSGRMRRIVLGLTGLMLTVKFVMLFDFEGLRPFSHKLFLLSLFPLTVGVLFAIVSAFRRGSRAALFLLIAATPLTASGMVELLMEMSAVPENLPLEEFFIFSMVVLVLGTFIAVGDRFVVLRVERDRANMRAIKMQRMAHSDALTGVSNRRAFDALGSIPDGKALLIADIDHFKAINDERGHPVGDAVIAQVATRLRHALPKDCETMIYRLGGEEFALVVTARDRSALECAAETMRRTVASGERRRADDLPAVTISVGGALGKGRPLREVYADADGALYRAKQAGRNRIAICGDG